MKACNQKWELEIDTKTDEGASLGLQTNGGPLHQSPLESVASKNVSFKHGTHPLQGTYTLTLCESPHLHQKAKRWSLIPISFWVHEG